MNSCVIKADYFWHGPSLNLSKAACLSPFIHHGLMIRAHFNLHLKESVVSQ